MQDCQCERLNWPAIHLLLCGLTTARHLRHPPLQFTLCNDLPALFPNVSKGISVHWHGWRMADGAQW